MVAMLKKKQESEVVFIAPQSEVSRIEVAKVEPIPLPSPPPVAIKAPPVAPPAPVPTPVSRPAPVEEKKVLVKEEVRPVSNIDRVRNLFAKGSDKLPIVETVTYTSRVPWLKGRPAWIADYASHYGTSRHFIARSLNGKADYMTQKVSPGDKFNVFRQDKNFEFYLLVDLSTRQMHFYYLDKDLDERGLLKTYLIGVGRKKEDSPSGSLTPVGKYLLGSKVAVYRPGVQGYYQNQKTEMIRIFGTRWLPFAEEIGECSDGAKGYGIHGVPCTVDEATGELIEEASGVGGYNSDGCLRLKKEDMEEIFSIVITKPTVVEIVKDMKGVKLPMSKEANYVGS